MLHKILEQKIQESKWTIPIPEAIIKQWVTKVESHMSHEVSAIHVQFQLTEMMHYLTETDLLTLNVPEQPEHEYLVRKYIESHVDAGDATFPGLQTPAVTFGKEIPSKPCPVCRRRRVSSMALQTLSLDEPTSYYHQCRDCNHRWKDR